MAYTTDELVSACRLRSRLPDDAFTSAEILAMADAEHRSIVLPAVRAAHQDFYRKSHDVAVAAGVATYRLPTRAQHAGLLDVRLLDAAGRDVPIEPMAAEEAWRARNTGGGMPWRFALEHDHIELLPSPNVSGYTLRMQYNRRPNRFVLVSACAAVASGGGGASITTAATIPSTFTTNTPLDYISARPSFDWLAIDRTPTTASGTSLVFATAPSSEGTTGDYLALAGETPVIQLPVEAHSVLEDAVAFRMAADAGNRPRAAILAEERERKLRLLTTLLTPRAERQQPALVLHDSPMRWGR